jgi:hypothetical protein
LCHAKCADKDQKDRENDVANERIFLLEEAEASKNIPVPRGDLVSPPT